MELDAAYTNERVKAREYDEAKERLRVAIAEFKRLSPYAFDKDSYVPIEAANMILKVLKEATP